jgi:hypothetical protein
MLPKNDSRRFLSITRLYDVTIQKDRRRLPTSKSISSPIPVPSVCRTVNLVESIEIRIVGVYGV